MVKHNVKLSHSKGRGNLVLDNLSADPIANQLVPLLDGIRAPQINPDRAIELQRPATRSDFGIPEEDPHFLPQLVDEYHGSVGLAYRSSQLPERL